MEVEAKVDEAVEVPKIEKVQEPIILAVKEEEGPQISIIDDPIVAADVKIDLKLEEDQP